MGLFWRSNTRPRMKTEREILDTPIGDIEDKEESKSELEARVSRLEDAKFEADKIADGGIKIGGVLVARGADVSLYATLLSGYLSRLTTTKERQGGVMIGNVKDLRDVGGVRLSDSGAIALRDWLLKEFPLEKPAAKKKGK